MCGNKRQNVQGNKGQLEGLPVDYFHSKSFKKKFETMFVKWV